MKLKTYKRYAQNKQARQQRKRTLIYLAVALLLVAIISGSILAFSANVGAKSSDPALGVATFANPDNPECPYETPLVEKPTAARMETSLRLDLSDESTPHFVNLVVPSSELALLTDGRIQAASDVAIGNAIYMTGDKIGVVQSVEHKLFTPEPTKTDGRGNVFSRVIGKSERFVETMLYLHTPNEVIKTTPEHPFYVSGVWVEAQHLNPGDKIRSRTGKTIEVVRTEIVHDPQMVYSLLVEGTHNFYVGEEGLLAHNCTPTIKSARTLAESLGQVDSNTIRFTQDSISSSFRNGNSVQATIDGLRSGTISPNDFPPIRVFTVDGQLFTLDNRRLYAFQQAGLPINTVPATL